MTAEHGFQAWVLFGFALCEVCLLTSWPLHTQDLLHPSMLLCLISTFLAVPVGTYHLVVAMATKDLEHPRYWRALVLARQVLISYVLLNPVVYLLGVGALCAWQWVRARLRGEGFDAGHAVQTSMRRVTFAIVLVFGLLGWNAKVALTILLFACLPLHPRAVKANVTDLAVFYLYCSTWAMR